MSSIPGRNVSQIFQVNVQKSSYSRNSKSSFLSELGSISSGRSAKRGRSSSRSGKNALKCKALFDFKGYAEGELSFYKGDEIQVISQDDGERANWWRGRAAGKEGIFPCMYVAQNYMRLQEVREIGSGEISVRRLIGKGGFSTVRLGTWKNRDVAVKIILDSSGDKNSMREALYYWLLRHPNIISLLGICKHPSEYWLVMEYASGGSLAQTLSKNFLPLHIVIDWSTQIARAMKYLHQDAPLANIVHRDLKSKNILIFEAIIGNDFENKTLKITDFGLARHDFQTSLQTELAGTFIYMAPEVIRHHHISTASDVWSFGIVLWEILTSQVPFKNFNHCQLLLGIGRNELRLPIPRSCPEPFQQLLERCWNIDPKERLPFAEIVKCLQSTRPSVIQTGAEYFKTLQQEWANEMEVEMETIKSESVNTMNDIPGNDAQALYESFLEKVSDGINQRYKQLESLQMELVAKQLYYAMLQLTSAKKHKRRLKNFFSWRKKGSLKIGTPSNFKHHLQTIVEETKIFPKLSPNMPSPAPFTIRILRVNTNTSQEDVQKMSTESLQPVQSARSAVDYSVVPGLRRAMIAATCLVPSIHQRENTIISNTRGSLLPKSSATRPTTLDVKPFHLPSHSTRDDPLGVSSVEGQRPSPFKLEIKHTQSKSTVYVTGNNPKGQDYMRQSVFKVENVASPATGTSQISFFTDTSVSPPPPQFTSSAGSFPTRISLYGSMSNLKSKADRQDISNKIFVPTESFPVHKVNQRQSLLNLKGANKVAELRAFFSQKLDHDKPVR